MNPRHAQLLRVVAATAATSLFPSSLLAQVGQTWTHAAADPQRSGAVRTAFPSLAAPLWTRGLDSAGRVITFSPRGGVAVGLRFVYAAGMVQINAAASWRLYALDRRDGTIAFEVPIDTPLFESIVTPALDQTSRTVLVASGSTLLAIDADSPTVRWSVALNNPVVNASPLVVRDWRSPARVFITDYDGFGDSASLYAIALDPHASSPASAAAAPGDILWSVPIGASSGNSPAYDPRRASVLTAAVGLYASGPGQVFAFDAFAPGPPALPPAPRWVFDNPQPFGFFGGVGFDLASDRVLVASYAFFGGLNSGNIAALAPASGAPLWSASSNRSAAVPVALPPVAPGPARLALATGLAGFGTLPSLQIFGTGGAPIWSSHQRTWTDANANAQIDAGEYVPAALWNTQPLFSSSSQRLAVVGSDNVLRILDVASLDQSTSPFVVVDSAPGITGSPALAGSNLYAISTAGLRAFGSAPLRPDVNADGVVSLEDLYAWEQSRGQRDVNADGTVNAADRDALTNLLRADETAELTEGRR